MAYLLITDDNKIYAGGYNQYGITGTSTTTTTSTYNYALYPPKEIVYTTLDGTTLDGSMIKDFASGLRNSVIIDKSGCVYTCGYTGILGDGTNATRSVFSKVDKDLNGNNIDNIKQAVCLSSGMFLLREDGIVLGTGSYCGWSTSSQKSFGVITVDDDGNAFEKIKYMNSYGNNIVFVSESGNIYTLGALGSNNLADNNSIANTTLYFPKKASTVKNVEKAIMLSNGILAIDVFGEVWILGTSNSLGYSSYSGEFFDGNYTTDRYINISKSSIESVWVQDSSSDKLPLPKKIVDIFGASYAGIKYLDDNDNINIITLNSFHSLFGGGSTTTGGNYWYNHKGSGLYDFDNEYNGIYILDSYNTNAAIASFSRSDGKMYVTGSKGLNGTTTDNKTTPKLLPGTEDLNIVRVFNEVGEINFQDLKYTMPDESKSKIKLRCMR